MLELARIKSFVDYLKSLARALTDRERDASTALWWVPFLLSILIPGLWWTDADRPHAFRLDLVFTMTALVGLFGFVVLAAISRGFRSRIRWSLGVSTVVLVLVFQWSSLTWAGRTIDEATGLGVLHDVVPVALGGAMLWLAVRRAGELPFALVVGAAVTLGVTSLGLSALAVSAPAPEGSTGPAPVGTRQALLLVLDGYSRADVLQDLYNFDNSYFVEQLEDRGFVIANEATANYPYTYASVSSMLNLDYVFPPGPIQPGHLDSMRGALTGATGIWSMMRDAGYRTAYVENAWGGSHCGPGVDWCIRDGLLRRATWNLGQMTILAPLFDLQFRDPFNSLSFEHLKSLPELLTNESPDGAPTFLFAHILLPHAPLLLNEDCEFAPDDRLAHWGTAGGELAWARRNRYASQVQCVNDLVIGAIDRYVTTYPNALVMITADHGPGSLLLDFHLPVEKLSGDVMRERLPILSAYRLEGCSDQPYASVTPTNGARLLANCGAGSALGLLPDRSYWLDLYKEGNTTDITGLIGG